MPISDFSIIVVLDLNIPLPASAWQRLGEYLRETQLLGSIQNTLYWDQNTSMPSSGFCWRGEQLSLIARYLHSRLSDNYFEELILEAKIEYEEYLSNGDFTEDENIERYRNLELLEQELSRRKRIDPELVVKLAEAKSIGYMQWKQAKSDANFQHFAPALSHLIVLRKEEASQIGFSSSSWETLAQPFEPDLRIDRLEELFKPLRERLSEMVREINSFEFDSFDPWDIDEQSQHDLCGQLLREWGRDEKISRLDQSPHPFSITLGPKDFRLTTRIVEGKPLSCFLATAHEWGHSLYEQGLPSQTHQWFAWPLGQATSMGLHESQSLFWENRVARSYAFAEKYWRYFAKSGAPINSGMDLWHSMNPLKPGLNRVEADELSYGLHILIRTDLEISLLDKGLDVKDLPAEWNRKYKDLLGVVPRNDAEGCLQDVHWSEGQFGYFPSYLLGHLISAQFAEAMSSYLQEAGIQGTEPIETCITENKESLLLSWLRKKVHPYGRRMNAEALVKEVTGSSLSSVPFLSYLEKKVERIMRA